MMTHDPFQNYQTTGAYSGGATQFAQPGTAFQPFINPLAFAGQQMQNPGFGGYGIPQPYQGAGFAGYGIPQPYQQGAGFAGQQNPQGAGFGGYGIPQPYQGAGFAGQQNPLQQLMAVNPLAAAAMQNQLLQQALLQNAIAQNPAGQGAWQNPLLQASLQNPLLQASLQNPLLQASLQNPFLQHQQAQSLWQNPFLQHQQAQGPWQNPMLAASLQNPQFNPLLALYGWQQQQPQLTYPLAPQSLIGAGGIGQPFSQIHPLAQIAQRQAGGYGASPFAGYF